MFKSVFKSLILSVLCIFTISCSFISENSGSLQLKLPSANEIRDSRAIDNRGTKKLSYSVVITPDKTNYNQFSFSEDDVTDKLVIERIPAGKYTITINGSDSKYKYFNEPEVFYIKAGKKTTLNIKLKSKFIEEVKPTPEPEKPNVSETIFDIRWDYKFDADENPSFSVQLCDPTTKQQLYKYSINKNGDAYTGIKAGKYLLKVSSSTTNYIYTNNVNEIIDIKPNINNKFKIALNRSSIETQVDNTLYVSFTNSFDVSENPNFTVILVDESNREIKRRENIDKNGCSFEKLKFGKYKLNITGSSVTKEYKYNANELFEIKVGNPTSANIKLVATELLGNITGTITNIPSESEGITLTVTAINEANKEKTYEGEVSGSTYTIKNLPIGNYTISIVGGNNSKHYSGNGTVAIKQGENIGPTIDLVLNNKLGSISGKVTNIPQSNNTNLTLKAYAYNAITKNSYAGMSTVDVSTGTFQIKDIPVGDYSITVEGSSDEASYTGNSESNVTVSEGGTTQTQISLNTALKTGSITLTSSDLVIDDSALFTIDIKKENTPSSLNGYPIENKSLPYKIQNLESGNYEVSITGIGNSYKYNSALTKILVEPGNNTKSTNITLNKTLRTGSILLNSSNIVSGDNAKFTIDVRKENEQSSLSGYPKTQQSLPYKLQNLESGNYEVSISGSGDKYTYESEPLWSHVVIIPEINDKSTTITLKKTPIKGTISGCINISNIPSDTTFTIVAKNIVDHTEYKGTIDQSNKTYIMKDVPLGKYKVILSYSLNSIPYTKESTVELTKSTKNGTSDFNITALSTNLYVSNQGNDDKGLGTADAPFKTISKVISLISDNKTYTIKLATDITEDVNINKNISLILTSSDISQTKTIKGSISLNSVNAKLELNEIYVSSDTSSETILLNNGSLNLNKNIIIENTRTSKTAVKINDNGVLTVSSSDIMIVGNILVNNVNKNPSIKVTVNYTSPICTIKFNNINAYTTVPVVDSSVVQDKSKLFTLEDSTYKFNTDGTLSLVSKPTPNPDVTIKPVFYEDTKNGKKEFDSLTEAIQYLQGNVFGVSEYVINVTKSFTETLNSNSPSISVEKKFIINGPSSENVTVNTPNLMKVQGNGAFIELGKNIQINNTTTSKVVFTIGTGGTLGVTSSENIGKDNIVNFLFKGKLNFKQGYAGADGAIHVTFKSDQGEEVGEAQGNVFITTESSSLNISEAVKKVSLESNKYIINSDGTLALKDSNIITSVSDLQTKIDNAKNGDVLTLKMGPNTPFIGVDKTISITKNITLTAADPTNAPIKLLRNNNEINLINIKVETRKPSGTPEVIIEGFHLDGKDSLKKTTTTKHAAICATDTNVILKNCVVENNSDTGILLVGDITAEINNTIVRNNTSIDNGGGIYLDSVNGFPDLKLSGNTTISLNKAGTSNLGGGIYVKEGYIKLLNNATITTDNEAGTGPVLAFQNKNNCQLNDKSITNQHYSTLVDINTNK